MSELSATKHSVHHSNSSSSAAVHRLTEAAQFKWRASRTWQRGTHSTSSVKGFFGLGEEQSHRTGYTFEADHPEVLASGDKGATPVECILVGLASCLTAGVAAIAQNRGVQPRSVTATLEAGMDIQGILGIDAQLRNGCNGINVHFHIDADAGQTPPTGLGLMKRQP